MSAIILKFLTPLAPYLAIAAVVLAAVFYVVHLRNDLASANAHNATQAVQISQLAQTNQANLAAIADFKTQQASWNAALDTLDAQTLTTNAATADIIGNINVAPASADAPAALVLTQALAAIAKLQGGAP